jgi:hypothetical protein
MMMMLLLVIAYELTKHERAFILQWQLFSLVRLSLVGVIWIGSPK